MIQMGKVTNANKKMNVLCMKFFMTCLSLL